jgi:hypothetical protein
MSEGNYPRESKKNSSYVNSFLTYKCKLFLTVNIFPAEGQTLTYCGQWDIKICIVRGDIRQLVRPKTHQYFFEN